MSRALASKPPRLGRAKPAFTDLPWEVLRRVMLFTMGTHESPAPGGAGETFLNASNPAALRNGIALAFTCKRLLAVFRDALTGVKLVSSWQAEQATLIAACKIAARNLRAIHVECSAPVTAALKEVVAMRPPVRHFVLIGVNISKALMADIIFYVGRSLETLTISAAPSLDDTVVDLIADCCGALKHLELGGSRRVSAASLVSLFGKVGHILQGIELNSLQHDLLDEQVLFAMADYCERLTYVRLLKLRWVTDRGLERLFRLRAHQLTELRLVSCRRASVYALFVLSMHGAALEKLNFCFDKGELLSGHRPSTICAPSSDDEADECCYDGEPCLSVGEKALVQLSRKCRNLRHLSISDATISDEAMNRLSRACGTSLKILNLRHCSSLGNNTLSCLAKNVSSLLSLDLSYLPLIEDDGLHQLLASLQGTLEELQIIGCSGLTDRALQEVIPRFALREALPRVTLCGASNCPIQ